MGVQGLQGQAQVRLHHPRKVPLAQLGSREGRRRQGCRHRPHGRRTPRVHQRAFRRAQGHCRHAGDAHAPGNRPRGVRRPQPVPEERHPTPTGRERHRRDRLLRRRRPAHLRRHLRGHSQRPPERGQRRRVLHAPRPYGLHRLAPRSEAR